MTDVFYNHGVRGGGPTIKTLAENAGSAKQAAKNVRTRNGRRAADNAVPRCRGIMRAGVAVGRVVASRLAFSRRGLAWPDPRSPPQLVIRSER